MDTGEFTTRLARHELIEAVRSPAPLYAVERVEHRAGGHDATRSHRLGPPFARRTELRKGMQVNRSSKEKLTSD